MQDIYWGQCPLKAFFFCVSKRPAAAFARAARSSLSLSQVGIHAAVYLCSVALSMFINNSATVAILGAMLTTIAEKGPALHLRGLLWTLTYNAGSCFTTPLGYQTNLMVMPAG